MPRWIQPWKDFFDEMREAFEESFEKSLRHIKMPFEVSAPSVDVIDKGDEILVSAEIPGVDKKDLHVTVTEDKITISGETKFEEELKGKNFYRSERKYGKFTRTVPLPELVDTKTAKASYKNGVLNISIKKQKPIKEKEIEIEIE